MKGSTGITIVVAIGIACLIGGSLANDVIAYETDDNATTPKSSFLSELTENDQWKNTTNFFICPTPNKIFTRPYIIKNNKPPTLVEISDSPEFSSKFPIDMYSRVRLVSGCFNKTLNILKRMKKGGKFHQVLDVIKYEGNNKFQRIKRVLNMFIGAIALTTDWTTGNMYWLDLMYNVEGKYMYGIKVTNELFEPPQYVIEPTEEFIYNQIQVYPKRKEIYFSDKTHIWYSSTLPHSTPKLLFTSKPSKYGVFGLFIDYVLDKLCWASLTRFHCVYIGGSTRPLNVIDIDSHLRPHDSLNFAVFNGTFYWLRSVKQKEVLYARNGNNTSIIV